MASVRALLLALLSVHALAVAIADRKFGTGREREPASDGKDPTRAVNRYGSTRSMNLCIHT
ncbi:hypothetical protein DPX16_16494 [Anabarilius grahami]|uniref:Uncharacterized protein n=1 Tax=Anabarilius grahami TaxID=495550 RepID=A0A3N0XYZ7_ANAGA|nr:hypothetical protein DPX16_16494 [Anabarilius grahami]